ncbi:MAG: hypothetical protein M3068_05320 [Gemmatimonadota bacterium]|nr:hypothetical protein [Gemmatimonadota bacterium]
MAAPQPEDKGAGITGLIVAVIFLLVMVTTIVAVTNRVSGPEAEASATK